MSGSGMIRLSQLVKNSVNKMRSFGKIVEIIYSDPNYIYYDIFAAGGTLSKKESQSKTYLF